MTEEITEGIVMVRIETDSPAEAMFNSKEVLEIEDGDDEEKVKLRGDRRSSSLCVKTHKRGELSLFVVSLLDAPDGALINLKVLKLLLRVRISSENIVHSVCNIKLVIIVFLKAFTDGEFLIEIGILFQLQYYPIREKGFSSRLV